MDTRQLHRLGSGGLGRLPGWCPETGALPSDG